jgi:flavorubredoxin
MFAVPDPLRIAEDTYLVRPLVELSGTSLSLHVNSLVIQGREPVIVDTGAALFRDDWVEQVFGLVDPQDVRWIFLSHDDDDHIGNVEAVLEACPRATLVTSWLDEVRAAWRPRGAGRLRRLDNGDTLDVADRRLVAVRPPTFDSPATRGLYDASTGVYWSSDAFGTPVTEALDSVGDLPPELWHEESTIYSSLLSPWHTVVDVDKFGSWVDRTARLEPRVIASAHGPVLLGPSIGTAVERMRELPRSTTPSSRQIAGTGALP